MKNLKNISRVFVSLVLGMSLLFAAGFSYDFYTAQRLKQEGNRLFNSGEYDQAFSKYNLALSKWSPPEEKRILKAKLERARQLSLKVLGIDVSIKASVKQPPIEEEAPLFDVVIEQPAGREISEIPLLKFLALPTLAIGAIGVWYILARIRLRLRKRNL